MAGKLGMGLLETLLENLDNASFLPYDPILAVRHSHRKSYTLMYQDLGKFLNQDVQNHPQCLPQKGYFRAL